MTDVFDMTEFSKAIATKRANLKINLRDLHKITGIDISTLSRIERGVGMPLLENYLTLRAWLGIKEPRFIPCAHCYGTGVIKK